MPHVEAILGKAGSGKSRLLTALCINDARLVVVDTMLEHGELAPQEHADDLYEDIHGGRPYRGSIWCQSVDDVEWVANLCASQRHVTLAIDEYSYWYPTPTHLPGAGVLAIVRCGRKLAQRLVVCTQSPGAISKQMLSQARMWILPLNEPRERQYVLDRTGGAVDPGELTPYEADGQRVIAAHVASYADGVRADWRLEMVGPTLIQE